MSETTDIRWVLTDNHITCSFGGKTHMVARTDANANAIIDALKAKRYDEVPELVSVALAIEKYTEGNFKVVDGSVMVDDQEVHGLLAIKIRQFHSEGLPYMPLVKFARNVRKNPSERAVNDLYAFLEQNKHPITDDGCFIAYKKVSRSFKDLHTGTMDNSVGQTVVIPRAEVDDDAERTCSRGLHLSNFDYCSNHYGSSNDVIIEAKCNPASVVAIPKDYGAAKMRVCKYTVLSVIEKPVEVSYRDTSSLDAQCEDCDELIGDCECGQYQ